MTGLARARLQQPAAPEVLRFTASLPVDRRLYRQDIQGSMAHARMLARQGLLAPEEAEAIVRGLADVLRELEEGTFPFRPEDEDIHLAVERRLAEKIGPVAGKLHTARSRNDQVVADVRLWLKEAIARIRRALHGLQGVLLDRAEEEVETFLPGYTHLQRAQPLSLAHHLLAYFWMLERDDGRFADCARRADVCPLGAAALAGTGLPVDPAFTAQELGFSAVFENSVDAVADRDFILEFLAAAAICQAHLSRLAAEVVLWSSQEFGFLELDDAYAGGSSIMPQKKNPDAAELVRGKAGRVYGNLMALLTVLHGLPLAYHSDLQEDKERLFDTYDTLLASLEVTAGMLRTARFRRDRMREALNDGFLTATDLAEYLVERGVPFREAHALVGRIVQHCLARGCRLDQLTAAELQQFSPHLGEAARALLDPEAAVRRRRSPGGTAPEQVRHQLQRARARHAARSFPEAEGGSRP